MSDIIRTFVEYILDCKCLSEEELRSRLEDCYKKAYDSGYKKGYAKCAKDYGIDLNEKSVNNSNITNRNSRIEVAILFIKADRGFSVIEAIKQDRTLNSNLAESLYENTQKLWVGSQLQLAQNGMSSIFDLGEVRSDFGPEYDSIAISVKLSHPINVVLTDSFSIHDFINNLCEENCVCDCISQRLPLNAIQKYNLINI